MIGGLNESNVINREKKRVARFFSYNPFSKLWGVFLCGSFLFGPKSRVFEAKN